MSRTRKLGAAALAAMLGLAPGSAATEPKDEPVRATPAWESEGVWDDGSGYGYECGDDCVHTFGGGTFVILTAEPDTTSRFAGWSRECSPSDPEGQCTFRLDATESVTATFELGPLD